MDISNWMSWEGGVDMMAATVPGLPMPNVVVHVARMVHTPVGSAPSGLVFVPDFDDPTAPPQLMGFVSSDPKVGDYFGPHIFAGTPFENAPVLVGDIEIVTASTMAYAKVTLDGFVLEVQMTGLGPLQRIERPAGAMPFAQHCLESDAKAMHFSVNGEVQRVDVVPVSLTGGHGAIFSACGWYAL